VVNFDLLNVLVLFAITGFVVVAYAVRVLVKGQAHFARVDQQGGSSLLGKSLMEMAYWVFQPMARLLIFCHVTPNQISWGSLVFGFLAGCCLVFGHFGFAAGFATVSGVMDSLDGLVARLTACSSDSGEVLDAAVDRYVEFFFLGGLVIYYREVPVLMGLSLLALMGSFMVSYSTAKAEALQVTPPKGSMRRPERALYLTVGAALSPITISLWEVDRQFSIPVAYPMVIAITLVAVVSHFSVVERLMTIAKAVKQQQKKRTDLAQAHEIHEESHWNKHAED
jgi:phosphatidylglycerophosphate synthase